MFLARKSFILNGPAPGIAWRKARFRAFVRRGEGRFGRINSTEGIYPQNAGRRDRNMKDAARIRRPGKRFRSLTRSLNPFVSTCGLVEYKMEELVTAGPNPFRSGG